MPVNLTQYQGEIGVFNVSIITIKIKHRPISRRCYFCNTNQVYRNIYFFLYCYLLFYYITSIKKNPQNLTPLYRSLFLLTILHSSLDVQVKNIYQLWYWNQSRSCAKNPKVLWLSQSVTVERLYCSPQNGYHLFIGNLSWLQHIIG